MIWEQAITLETLNKRSENTAASHLGIDFTEIGDDFLVATLPITDKCRQPLGWLHGGISVALAETVGSTAANACVDQNTHFCVGLDINANHVRSVQSGIITARAEPIHLGKTTQVWHISIHDESAKLCCISRLTMSVLSR